MGIGTSNMVARRLALPLELPVLRRLDAVPPARMFLILYMLALAVGITIGLTSTYRASPAQLDWDEREYWEMSSQLLAGNFELLPRRTFAFPLILAALRTLSPGLLGVQMLITAIFALSAPIVFLLARKLGGGTGGGAIAGGLTAIWPPLNFYGASLYSEPPALVFFLLTLWAIPPGSRLTELPAPLRWRTAFGAGLLLAITTQIRSMYLLFLPFALLAIMLEERRARVGIRRGLALLAGFALLTLPWSVYMTMRFHHVILVTANGGETLSGGLSPKLLQQDGRIVLHGRSTWVGAGKWMPVTENGYLTADEMSRLPYDRQDALLRERTLAWVWAKPGDALYVELCKVGYMWGVYRMADNGWVQMLFGNLPIIALLTVAMIALLTKPTLRRLTPRLWLVPLFVTGIALISWGSWRFRQPADAALLTLVTLAWASASRRRQEEPGAGSDR